MSLTEVEQAAYAYYLAHDANQFTVTGRFYPHGELVLVIGDKVQVATRKFGRQVSSKANNVARVWLDRLIETGAYSTKQNDFGGSMHQFQPDRYKTVLRQEQDADPIILKAKEAGPEFWEQAFAELTGA
jgi:hypothetical protein